MTKREVEPIRQPTLFQLEKLGVTAERADQLKIERLCLAKILSGANAFEISDIQEDETEV